ncbi:hypothetical protein CEXT_101521 [Caerostris extrusa]|uniref:Uncharacterized protein n=1 Tax=Caerostris extrusa TaxID=172846 RepID=A0AAV4VBF0_CAEEX|nr:hypothetical protein CEXT_101521 [Caerostris extrusa]
MHCNALYPAHVPLRTTIIICSASSSREKPRWRTTAINGLPLTVRSRLFLSSLSHSAVTPASQCVSQQQSSDCSNPQLDLKLLLQFNNVRAKHQAWLGGFAPETCQHPLMETLHRNCFSYGVKGQIL